MQRDAGNEGEGRRRRIAGPQADERARIQVARRRVPVPALAAPAPALAVGAQPQALGRALPRPRQDIVVGGAGLPNLLDQNKAPAAVCAALSIQGIEK